jgi:hypothetical protein
MAGTLDSGHFVQFFHSDDELVRVVSDYLRDGFRAGCTCIAVVKPGHREAIDAALIQLGLDPEALAAAYQYIPLDTHATLSAFMKGERPDRERFHSTLGLLLAQAASRGSPLRIYGEMVAVLAERKLPRAVIELEELWNELSRERAFTLLCGYPDSLLSDELSHMICAVHSNVRAA